STSGLSASAPTTTTKPVQYAALGPSPRARAALMASFRRRHEQTGGPDEEGEDQRDERHDHGLGRADPDRGQRFQQADEDGGEDGAAEIPHAAHDHHDEGAKGEVEPHRVVDAHGGAEEHAAGGGHGGADREHHGVDPRHRDAHGGGHDAVLRRRADPDAVLAVLHEQIEGADDGRRHQGDDDPVPRVLDVEEAEVSAHRLQDLAGHGAVLPERVVLDDQREPEGG